MKSIFTAFSEGLKKVAWIDDEFLVNHLRYFFYTCQISVSAYTFFRVGNHSNYVSNLILTAKGECTRVFGFPNFTISLYLVSLRYQLSPSILPPENEPSTPYRPLGLNISTPVSCFWKNEFSSLCLVQLLTYPAVSHLLLFSLSPFSLSISRLVLLAMWVFPKTTAHLSLAINTV